MEDEEDDNLNKNLISKRISFSFRQGLMTSIFMLVSLGDIPAIIYIIENEIRHATFYTPNERVFSFKQEEEEVGMKRSLFEGMVKSLSETDMSI